MSSPDNLSRLAWKKGLNNPLFEQVQQAAGKKGEPSPDSLRQLAKAYLMGEASVLGASSFYDFLKRENRGKKAYLCNGTACLLAGKQPAVREKLLNTFKASEIGEACCLGRCHENAAFQIDQRNYSGEDIDRRPQIWLSPPGPKDLDHYHCEAFSPVAVLTQPLQSIAAYYALFQHLQDQTPDDLLKTIMEAELRGRGGAGFPIGVKMKACREAVAPKKFIVCNADEGDPGSYSDRYLLEQHPHAVLFGMLVSGYICGANTGVIYIRAEYPEAIRVMKNAVEDYRTLPPAICQAWNFNFKIISGAGSYICGEETALLASIEGLRPEVRIRPPYPTTAGLFGFPTLVNNVETLANLHFILEHGAKIFQSLGTPGSKGTKLICLDSYFNRPGVYEVEFGTPLRKIIGEMGLGFRAGVKALHIGGPLGGVVPREKWDELLLDFESFSQAGFSLGHASFISIPDHFPMIEYLEHLLAFAARESCGKCFPCRLGTQRGLELIQQAHRENKKINPGLFSDLLVTLELGSLCGLGKDLPLPIKNILQYFSEELQNYFHKTPDYVVK